MEDMQIIELYNTRDEAAISETQRKYGAFCMRIATNVLSVREDAEECVNDTYHCAWRQIPPAVPLSLQAFLGRITRNLSISRFRKKRAQKRFNGLETMLSELLDCVPDCENVEEAMENSQLAECISAWLDSLTEESCALFVRRYWYADSLKELAQKCGVPQNRLAQNMLRLRKGLKAALEEKGVSL